MPSTTASAATLTIAEAQRDVRVTFHAGFPGHLVVAAIWFASAALATWGSVRAGIVTLVFGGMFIFPLTQLVLRTMGRPASLSKGHPMNALAMQTAFIVPLCLPLIGAAALHHVAWFYPAFMIVVGVHYLPFVTLYGMRSFAVLGAILLSAGLLIGLCVPSPFALGGWFAALLFLVFAFIFRAAARHAQLP